MKKIFAITIIFYILIAGCTDSKSRSTGVYMLLDTSGTYAVELEKAQKILNYLLGVLAPGDSLAVARIDTGTWDNPEGYERFNPLRGVGRKSVKGSPYTDISGGILQAIEYLNEAGSGKKYILIFSDLKEELAKGYKRDIPFQLQDYNVIALNVTKLRGDNIDPKEYMARVQDWRSKVENGGGEWAMINDLERLDNIFTN